MCGEEYPLTYYYKDKRKLDGLHSECKKCHNLGVKKWKQNNIDYVRQQRRERDIKNKDHLQEYQQEYNVKNKDIIKERRRIQRIKRKDKRKQESIIFKSTHPTYYKEYQQEQLKTNPQFKLSRSMRGRMSRAIKDNLKQGSAIRDLGCSVDELKKYLESKFYPNPETGEMMTWKNWGYCGWHIDHKTPLANFDLTDREQFLKACHYTNLQPLWAKDHKNKTKLEFQTRSK